MIPREDYRISSLNCGGEDFAVACMRANLRYEKNQKREDVKSHHYIISFDPRDGTDNSLTVDRAQELCEQFCKEHFPGHQALICTHREGLYQIDLLNGSKERITEREYWAAKKGQLALDKENAAREAAGQTTAIPEYPHTQKGRLQAEKTLALFFCFGDRLCFFCCLSSFGR